MAFGCCTSNRRWDIALGNGWYIWQQCRYSRMPADQHEACAWCVCVCECLFGAAVISVSNLNLNCSWLCCCLSTCLCVCVGLGRTTFREAHCYSYPFVIASAAIQTHNRHKHILTHEHNPYTLISCMAPDRRLAHTHTICCHLPRLLLRPGLKGQRMWIWLSLYSLASVYMQHCNWNLSSSSRHQYRKICIFKLAWLANNTAHWWTGVLDLAQWRTSLMHSHQLRALQAESFFLRMHQYVDAENNTPNGIHCLLNCNTWPTMAFYIHVFIYFFYTILYVSVYTVSVCLSIHVVSCISVRCVSFTCVARHADAIGYGICSVDWTICYWNAMLMTGFIRYSVVELS